MKWCCRVTIAGTSDSYGEKQMGDISRVALFGKLNNLGYKAIEGATVFCKLRGNPYVEMLHWFHQILQLQNSDLHCIARAFNIDASRLASDMTQALDRLPRGATSISDLSPHIQDSVQQAWVWSTLKFGESQVRTGHVVVAMLTIANLRNVLYAMSKEFERIRLDTLTEDFDKICGKSPESGMGAQDGTSVGAGAGAAPGESSGAIAPAAMGKQEALKKFTVDLTEQARTGKLDPIVGRDEEIRQVVDILMRRRQNNPLLTGEAGVGKTAVVEGFAMKIASGEVPPPLRDVELRSLDVGLLQAGASMKGEFEQRLRSVIEEVQASPKPIILFIDEAHTLVGAGGAAGTGDAANLLKPALARGTLRTVAATTWAEYKKHIEKDPALTRRFQTVQVLEPDENKCLLMIRGIASTMEKHHKVQLLDEALDAAVRLSHRYIPARQLPDKAVSLLDTACARVAISQFAVPPEVEDCRKRIEALEVELGIIGRETAVGVDTTERAKVANEKLAKNKAQLAELETRWNGEKALVEKILDIRGKLRGATGQVEGAAQAAPAAPSAGAAPVDTAALLAELGKLQAELAKLQGEKPLILPTADHQAVASVVESWTGIPVGRMVKNEVESILKLADN